MWTIYFEKSKTQSDILKYSYESTLLCHLISLWHLTINERNALFIIRLAGYVNMYDPMLERTEFANKKNIKISFYNIPLPEYWAQRILTHFTCKNQNVPFLKRIIDLPHSEKLGCLETSHSIVKFRVFLLCLFWALFQFVYSRIYEIHSHDYRSHWHFALVRKYSSYQAETIFIHKSSRCNHRCKWVEFQSIEYEQICNAYK